MLKPTAQNSAGRHRTAPQSQGLVKWYIYYIIPLYLSYCVPLSFHNFSSKANISALSQKSKQRTVNIYWPAYYEISLLVWEWLCYWDKRGELYHIRKAIIRLRPKEGEMNWTNTQSLWAKSYTQALHWQQAHTLACMHCYMRHQCIGQWLRSTTHIIGYILVKIKKKNLGGILCAPVPGKCQVYSRYLTMPHILSLSWISTETGSVDSMHS